MVGCKTEKDGVEAIAEVEVLLVNNKEVPPQAMDLYKEYMNDTSRIGLR